MADRPSLDVTESPQVSQVYKTLERAENGILPRWHLGTRAPSNLIGAGEPMRHQPVSTIRACRQLTPQPEADVNPTAFSHPRFHQRAALGARVIRERVCEFYEIRVLRVTPRNVEEIQPTFLHPAHPIGPADGIGLVEHRVVRRQQFQLGVLVGPRCGRRCRIRAVLPSLNSTLCPEHHRPRRSRSRGGADCWRQIGTPLGGAHAGDDAS